MDNVEMRLATAADVGALAQLLSSTFYSYQGLKSLLTPVVRLGLCYDLAARLQFPNAARYQCLIAEVPDPVHPECSIMTGTVEITLRPLGLSRLRSQQPYISNLAVRRDYRHQGIGQCLLERCEEIAQDWKRSAVFLHVRQDNAIAQSLYRKLGYRSTDQYPPLSTQRRLLTKLLPDQMNAAFGSTSLTDSN
ncbi:MAG: N-acetyltransferase [Cyanobacteria bacterium P01_F01_bin.42]